MKTLIELFTENFKPYNVVPILGLSETFVLKNGYTKSDIDLLIKNGKIEKNNGGYRLTGLFIKEWSGRSYKYIPEFVKESY